METNLAQLLPLSTAIGPSSANKTCHALPANSLLAEHQEFIEALIEKGGPEPEEYDALTAWIQSLAEAVGAARINRENVTALIRETTETFFVGTMQFAALTKKHGYSGDFEVIDAIYLERTAHEPHLQKWDHYFHAQAAPRAARNRKTYFQKLLAKLEQDHSRAAYSGWSLNQQEPSALRVLNVASGPCRDLREWFDAHPTSALRFDCVDQDANAIHYASELCAGHLDAIRFHQANALRFSTSERFDLVWSAGLFDYLEDGVFVKLLKRLLRFTAPGGEVVIGNFGSYNPTRNYMELLGGWNLIHRSRSHLAALAQRAGVCLERVHIGQEPEGVNLFLHVQCP